MKNISPLFLQFCKDFENENVLGYEFVPDSSAKLKGLLRSDILNDEFHVFLEDPVGSAIAFWELENGKQPVVYLSSEGSPFSVIAKDFPEFLSLLYYGSYAALEIEGYLDYLRSKALYEKLGAEFTRKQPAGMSVSQSEDLKARLKSEFANYDQVIHWLGNHAISCPGNSFDTVVRAFNESPNVNDYIDSVLG